MDFLSIYLSKTWLVQVVLGAAAPHRPKRWGFHPGILFSTSSPRLVFNSPCLQFLFTRAPAKVGVKIERFWKTRLCSKQMGKKLIWSIKSMKWLQSEAGACAKKVQGKFWKQNCWFAEATISDVRFGDTWYPKTDRKLPHHANVPRNGQKTSPPGTFFCNGQKLSSFSRCACNSLGTPSPRLASAKRSKYHSTSSRHARCFWIGQKTVKNFVLKPSRQIPAPRQKGFKLCHFEFQFVLKCTHSLHSRPSDILFCLPYFPAKDLSMRAFLACF